VFIIVVSVYYNKVLRGLLRGNYMYDDFSVGGKGLVDVFDQTLDHLLITLQHRVFPDVLEEDVIPRFGPEKSHILPNLNISLIHIKMRLTSDRNPILVDEKS
jgi:hypothetical protein